MAAGWALAGSDWLGASADWAMVWLSCVVVELRCLLEDLTGGELAVVGGLWATVRRGVVVSALPGYSCSRGRQVGGAGGKG